MDASFHFIGVYQKLSGKIQFSVYYLTLNLIDKIFTELTACKINGRRKNTVETCLGVPANAPRASSVRWGVLMVQLTGMISFPMRKFLIRDECNSCYLHARSEKTLKRRKIPNWTVENMIASSFDWLIAKGFVSFCCLLQSFEQIRIRHAKCTSTEWVWRHKRQTETEILWRNYCLWWMKCEREWATFRELIKHSVNGLAQ